MAVKIMNVNGREGLTDECLRKEVGSECEWEGLTDKCLQTGGVVGAWFTILQLPFVVCRGIKPVFPG